METETGGSVTDWIGHLKQGEDSAAQPLWERYFERLVRLARAKLAGGRNLADDGEDVALSAFDSFCRAATAGRFPQLGDRDDLWRLLVSLTARKAVNARKHAARRKRGGGQVLDEAATAAPGRPRGGADLDALAGDGPTPEAAAEVAETCRVLLEVLDREDPTGTLRQVAIDKLEGYANKEIAQRLGCALRTVANRLELIRALWAGFRAP